MRMATWNYTKGTQELIDIFKEEPEIEEMRKELRAIDEKPDTVVVFLCSRMRRRIGELRAIDKWFDFDPPKAA